MKVYLLQHSYCYDVENQYDETKIIGIYSSRSVAEKVIEEYINLPGFCEHEISDFYISEYEIDKNHWTEGFCTV